MSDHMSDCDRGALPRNDVRQQFEFLMLHPPQLRKHILKLRLLSRIGLLQSSSDCPGPKCRDLLLQSGPSVPEISEEDLRQVLCDDVTLLKIHELIWRGEAGVYWSRKIENELDAEARLELDPEVDARIKATVAASVWEAFLEDPVAVSHERIEWTTAGMSRPRAMARQSLEVRCRASGGFSFTSDSATAIEDDDDLLFGDDNDAVTLGDGSNMFCYGSVQLTQAANAADIRSRLLVTCNTHHANTLYAGSGLDWFWATDTQDNPNVMKTDLLN